MGIELIQQKACEAANLIRSRWPVEAKHAIILGTGAGELADQIDIEVTIPYPEIPHFPSSTAMGHKGEWVCGRLSNQPVIAMRGRFHLYEGYEFDVATLPVHVMHVLGVKYLFVSNASGGINPQYASGEIMAIDSHIDLMFRRSSVFAQGMSSGRSVPRGDPYDAGLIERAIATGRRHGFVVHRGVYGGMLGPNYETRAEYRFLKKIGADVAGMSTVPEVTVAALYGMKVLGLSIVANVAKPDVLEVTSGQEVIDAAQVAGPKLKRIVTELVEHLPVN